MSLNRASRSSLVVSPANSELDWSFVYAHEFCVQVVIMGPKVDGWADFGFGFRVSRFVTTLPWRSTHLTVCQSFELCISKERG